MVIYKRDGSTSKFDEKKIEIAITKAMKHGSGVMKKNIAREIALSISEELESRDTIATVYEIEDMVYKKLIEHGQDLTAKSYEGYRAVQAFKRETNTIDDSIIGLLNKSNEDVMNENSNKNGVLASTQRDLIAGEVSKDIVRRKLLPAHIIQAHDDGILHYHDMDCAKRSLEIRIA